MRYSAFMFLRPCATVVLRSLCVVTLALVVTACERPPVEPPDDGVEVSFSQLNWLDDSGNPKYPSSRVGVAQFQFTNQAAASFIGDGGFINVVTTQDGATVWSVQNLVLQYPRTERMLSSRPTVQFAITSKNGTRVADIRYSLSVTSAPLAAFVGPPDSSASVTIRDYHVGGRNGGGSGLSDIPLIIGPWVGPGTIPGQIGEQGQTVAGGEDLPEVDEEINGCAPGAVARSIAYMLDQAGISAGDAQDIYETLKDLMGTDQTGTSDEGLLEGKEAWVDDLPIETELVNFGGGVGGAIEALQNKGDVEILISWSGGGGHVAMVTSIIPLPNGQYEITYVDDPEQGDGEAENQEHVITVNPDGSFDGGTVDGFVVETIQA